MIRWDGTNQRLLVNAQAEVAGAVTGAFNNVWQPSSVIGASLDPEAEFYLDGLICEIRIWNTAASDTVRDNLMSYMTTKWGS
ncbi:MAG: LamG-like jellyroll fold domain-containing protein [Acetobacteraceae bacterium]